MKIEWELTAEVVSNLSVEEFDQKFRYLHSDAQYGILGYFRIWIWHLMHGET